MKDVQNRYNKIKNLISKRICNYLDCSDENDIQYPKCSILNSDIQYHKCGCVKFGSSKVANKIFELVKEWIDEEK